MDVWRGRRKLATAIVDQVFDDVALVRSADELAALLEAGDELRPRPFTTPVNWERP